MLESFFPQIIKEDLCILFVMFIVQHVIVGQTLTSFHRFIDPLENQSYQGT